METKGGGMKFSLLRIILLGIYFEALWASATLLPPHNTQIAWRAHGVGVVTMPLPSLPCGPLRPTWYPPWQFFVPFWVSSCLLMWVNTVNPSPYAPFDRRWVEDGWQLRPMSSGDEDSRDRPWFCWWLCLCLADGVATFPKVLFRYLDG